MSPWPPPHLDLVKRIQTDNRIFKEPEKKKELAPETLCSDPPAQWVTGTGGNVQELNRDTREGTQGWDKKVPRNRRVRPRKGTARKG